MEALAGMKLEELPGSLQLEAADNGVLRLPNGDLQAQSERRLRAWLEEVRGAPEAFQQRVKERRRGLPSAATRAAGADAAGPEEGLAAAACAHEQMEVQDGSAALPLSVSLDPESPTGDFELQHLAGRGSFSTVYLAQRELDGRPVALKCVNLDQVQSEASRKKCVKEIRALEALAHPNIIRCEGHFRSPRSLFIVLEWAAGGDLKRMLERVRKQRSRFHETVIWNYFGQISDAVQYMHARRIIHRDIKPANVFILPNGLVKLGDLGLSRTLSQRTLKTYSKVGTPLYMAPEVVQGQGQDFKSDVWGLGCLLYELAMLRSPFEEGCKTMGNLFSRILDGDYSPIALHLSPEYAALVHDLLSVSPAERPTADRVAELAAVYLGERERATHSDSDSATSEERKSAESEADSLSGEEEEEEEEEEDDEDDEEAWDYENEEEQKEGESEAEEAAGASADDEQVESKVAA